MANKLTKEDICLRTQQYWNLGQDYGCYIEELLGKELSYAKKHPLSDERKSTRLRKPPKPVHTLALMVGESFEPLLQIICILKPKRLALILNNRYGDTDGDAKGSDLCDLVERLATISDLDDEFRPHLTENNFCREVIKLDTPTNVFHSLQEVFQKDENQSPPEYTNVVDITGAKKSMVVGAFLYAAHSELPITYVDFETYNTNYGKPYGYTCKIGEIANPYKAFQLRDWEQVRQLYMNYNFRGAIEMLGKISTRDMSGQGILGVMSGYLGAEEDGTLYASKDIEKVQRFAQVLEMYEAWDNGDYSKAKTLNEAIQPPLALEFIPWAISLLGDIWPSAHDIEGPNEAAKHLLEAHLQLKQGRKTQKQSIFAYPEQLWAYVCDEKGKIERLITKNEDYRSAYLRAAGLDEFLLKARLCYCFLSNKSELMIGGSWIKPCTLAEEEQHRWFKSLANHSGADVMRATLERSKELNLNLERDRAKLRISSEAPSFCKYWSQKELDLDTIKMSDKPIFTKLRGEAIHTHLYIPHGVACAAYNLVEAAVSEFKENWLNCLDTSQSQTVNYQVITRAEWARLCEVCELDFLPPKLRS
ncbi:MAG: hypothetical protein WAZ19_14875 [Anaerolineae bacterium]